MYKIQANQSGTRSIEVSDQHLQTIEKYSLLRDLINKIRKSEEQCQPERQRHVQEEL